MRKILLLPITLCLILAACGSEGDADDSATTGSSSTTSSAGAAESAEEQARAAGLQGTIEVHGTGNVADGGSISVEMDDTYFGPTFIEAEPGATFTVELENAGELPHTFSVDTIGLDTQVAPGETAEIEVKMPTATTTFHCRFHGDMGMQGALIATGAGAGAPSDGSTTTSTAGSGDGGY